MFLVQQPARSRWRRALPPQTLTPQALNGQQNIALFIEDPEVPLQPPVILAGQAGISPEGATRSRRHGLGRAAVQLESVDSGGQIQIGLAAIHCPKPGMKAGVEKGRVEE